MGVVWIPPRALKIPRTSSHLGWHAFAKSLASYQRQSGRVPAPGQNRGEQADLWTDFLGMLLLAILFNFLALRRTRKIH